MKLHSLFTTLVLCGARVAHALPAPQDEIQFKDTPVSEDEQTMRAMSEAADLRAALEKPESVGVGGRLPDSNSLIAPGSDGPRFFQSFNNMPQPGDEPAPSKKPTVPKPVAQTQPKPQDKPQPKNDISTPQAAAPPNKPFGPPTPPKLKTTSSSSSRKSSRTCTALGCTGDALYTHFGPRLRLACDQKQVNPKGLYSEALPLIALPQRLMHKDLCGQRVLLTSTVGGKTLQSEAVVGHVCPDEYCNSKNKRFVLSLKSFGDLGGTQQAGVLKNVQWTLL